MSDFIMNLPLWARDTTMYALMFGCGSGITVLWHLARRLDADDALLPDE